MIDEKDLMAPVLVMKTVDGFFYPIQAMEGISLQKQAEDNGNLNAHVISVEDVDGNTLWRRMRH